MGAVVAPTAGNVAGAGFWNAAGTTAGVGVDGLTGGWVAVAGGQEAGVAGVALCQPAGFKDGPVAGTVPVGEAAEATVVVGTGSPGMLRAETGGELPEGPAPGAEARAMDAGCRKGA